MSPFTRAGVCAWSPETGIGTDGISQPKASAVISDSETPMRPNSSVNCLPTKAEDTRRATTSGAFFFRTPHGGAAFVFGCCFVFLRKLQFRVPHGGAVFALFFSRGVWTQPHLHERAGFETQEAHAIERQTRNRKQCRLLKLNRMKKCRARGNRYGLCVTFSFPTFLRT